MPLVQRVSDQPLSECDMKSAGMEWKKRWPKTFEFITTSMFMAEWLSPAKEVMTVILGVQGEVNLSDFFFQCRLDTN